MEALDTATLSHTCVDKYFPSSPRGRSVFPMIVEMMLLLLHYYCLVFRDFLKLFNEAKFIFDPDYTPKYIQHLPQITYNTHTEYIDSIIPSPAAIRPEKALGGCAV